MIFTVFQRRIQSWLVQAGGKQSTPICHTTDWHSLLAIADNEEFLREAYRKILKRECDMGGLVHYMGLLRSQVPRKDVLRMLVTSEEGKGLGWHLDNNSPLYVGSSIMSGKVRRLLTYVPARLVHMMRRLYERALLRPLLVVDAKSDYLLRELQTRTEQLSAKLDSYVADLASREGSLIERVSDLSVHVTELHADVRRIEDIAVRATRDAAAVSERSIQEGFVRLSRQLSKLQRSQLTRDSLVSECSLRLTELDGSLRRIAEVLEEATRDLAASGRSMQESLVKLSRQMEELQQSGLMTQSAVSEISNRFHKVVESSERADETFEGISEALRMCVAGQSEIRHRLLDVISTASAIPVHSVFPVDGRILVTQCDGFILAVPGDEWRIAAHLAFRGPLEPGVSRLFSRLIRPGMTVVDIGAHIGWYTLLAARLLSGSGKVCSFEPSPETFRLLRANVQVNGFLETGLIQFSAMAVTDGSGCSNLGLCKGDSGHNSLFPENAWDTIAVETTSLDEALIGEPKVDIVKVDAEGAEPWILRGMRGIIRKNPQIRILMEFAPENLHRAGVEPRTFLKEIADHGLRISRIDDVSGEIISPDMDRLPDAINAMLFLMRDCGVEVGG